MSTLTQQLSTAWQQAVDANKLINSFEAAADDPAGQWRRTDTITFGVCTQQGKAQPGKNVYYAHNLTQSRPILGAVEEKIIPDLGFVCQYNGYRALRPGGQLKPLGKQVAISAAPERCRFSCRDASDPLSLLVRNPLLTVALSNYAWNIYYNAAPIDPNGHYLLVPTDNSVLTHYPQKLSVAFVEDAVSLFHQFEGAALLFFNSLHSGASVNHIHFQAIARSSPLPAETWPLEESTQKTAQKYALLKNYPAKVMVFRKEVSPTDLFGHIHALQQRDIPFNLMFAGSRILLIPRNIDHEIVAEFPGNGIAALGVCGKIITVDRQAYLNADKHRIASAFAKMMLPDSAW